MNKVILMGRLTRDPEVRYTQTNNTLVASFSLAVNRRFTREGDAQTADFINILDVKERRIKNILRELVDDGKLIDNGVTKGKRYKKANK